MLIISLWGYPDGEHLLPFRANTLTDTSLFLSNLAISVCLTGYDILGFLISGNLKLYQYDSLLGVWQQGQTTKNILGLCSEH